MACMFAFHDENGVNKNFEWIPILRFVLLTHFCTLGILLIIKQKTWLYRINFVCIVKAGSVWFLSILQFFYGTSEFCFRSQHDTWSPWATRAVSRKAPLGVKGLKSWRHLIYSENPTKQVQVVLHTFFPGIVSSANEEGVSNWHILQNTALFVSHLLVTQYASLKQVTASIQVFNDFANFFGICWIILHAFRKLCNDLILLQNDIKIK